MSVGYRLAPGHPFPVPAEDCWEALLWLRGAGKGELGIDVSRIAVGGISASVRPPTLNAVPLFLIITRPSGGNITAVLAHHASLANIPVILQLPLIPALDLPLSASDRLP